MNQNVRIWDFVLIAVSVLLCCTVWLIPKTEGNTVEISVCGNSVAEYMLSEDFVYRFEDGTAVVISGGSVWIEDADCPDKVCEKTGKISKTGQSILCIPKGISIVISGEGADAYVG